jgi:FMN phosphatase YigB (HAD superfamily)
MGKMKETQLEMFFEDISSEELLEEEIYSAFDMHPDWNDLDVTYEVEYNDTMTPITLEEFDTMVAPIAASWTGISEQEQRDYIMWEETKPLTNYDESDMLRKEIQELNATLYKQYKRVAELTDEVNSLKQKLETVTNIHSNTRKF